MARTERDNAIERERMPYVQIEANLWAVMRYPKTHPVAMIVGLANRDNVPLYFVQTWHPEPSRRRVVSQHDTVEEANASVLWDRSAVEAAARQNAGPPNGPVQSSQKKGDETAPQSKMG